MNDELFQPCPVCQGAGQLETEQGATSCVACVPMRVVPVGMNLREVVCTRNERDRYKQLLKASVSRIAKTLGQPSHSYSAD